jgi:hypothetical protein
MAVDKKIKWTECEEKILFDIVSKYLQEGKTQKEAFKEAAHSIGRTAGACSFRWNNKLRLFSHILLLSEKSRVPDFSPVFIGFYSRKRTGSSFLSCSPRF